jgi:hypothetical protein
VSLVLYLYLVYFSLLKVSLQRYVVSNNDMNLIILAEDHNESFFFCINTQEVTGYVPIKFLWKHFLQWHFISKVNEFIILYFGILLH